MPPSAVPVSPPPRTVRQPRQRHHAGRAQILAAIRTSAIDVFSRHGFVGATMQAVAEGAGLTKQQLLYYAGSKDELYAELLHEVVTEWRKALSLKEEAGHTPAQLLRDYVNRKVHYALKSGPVSRIFTAEMLAGGTHIAKYWPEMLEGTQSKARLLQRWMDQGLLRPRDPLLLLQQIWGMTQYYADYRAQVSMMMGVNPPAEAIADEIATTVLLACGLSPD
jgi:TetR/AcrR family transcriptional regulator